MTTAAEALSLVFVFTGLKGAECLQMWVEPAARRQRSSPEPGTSPVCPPCGGPEFRGRGPELRGRGPELRGRAEMSAGLRGGDGLSAARLAAVSQLLLASASCR